MVRQINSMALYAMSKEATCRVLSSGVACNPEQMPTAVGATIEVGAGTLLNGFLPVQVDLVELCVAMLFFSPARRI
jgi:hypothetical protein